MSHQALVSEAVFPVRWPSIHRECGHALLRNADRGCCVFYSLVAQLAYMKRTMLLEEVKSNQIVYFLHLAKYYHCFSRTVLSTNNGISAQLKSFLVQRSSHFKRKIMKIEEMPQISAGEHPPMWPSSFNSQYLLLHIQLLLS